ncbi:MAG: DMT family transporter [Gammaproteobacteria bacterium]|nr:putative amino-acid metabolite efflux pump [bacterium MnTg03]
MRFVDIILAISVPVIWGLGFTLAKVAFVLSDFPPILLIAFRFALTTLVLLWLVKPPFGYMHRIFWISVVSATVQYALTFTGLDGLNASTAIIVVQLEFPFMVIMAAVVFKDHLSWSQIAGIALAFSGIIMIAGQPQLQDDLLPVFLVIGGAFTWAVGQIMIKKLGGQVGGFTLIAWVAAFATPQLFFASWLFEEGQIQAIRTMNWIGWAVVVYLGLVMTALGYSIWYHLLGKFRISQVGPFLLLLPVTSIAGSVLLLDEQLSKIEFVGAIIVISSVWIITRRTSSA